LDRRQGVSIPWPMEALKIVREKFLNMSWKSDRQLTTGSFFSGIGGMDLGFEQAGFKGLWANEVEPKHASVFKDNFDIPMIQDSIHMVSSDTLVDTYGRPDVLIGGFPCVTYSKAAAIGGKRHSDRKPKRNYRKYAEEGGELFLHMRRMIGDIQPKAFVIENVTDLAGCSIVMETLRNTPCTLTGKPLGKYYTFHYGMVNTRDFGIAQNRKRMFVIGIYRQVEKPILELKDMQMRHVVGEILEENPDVAPLNGQELPNYIKKRIDGGYRDKPSIKQIGKDVIGNTCIAHYGSDQSTTMVMREDGTLTPYSIREYGRMQGFPENFKFPEQKRSYEAIGNAVSVPVAKAVAEAIAPLI
jgi:DNA (cytosine-5)-methyltransferase 1